jgi:hypothetical protein
MAKPTKRQAAEVDSESAQQKAAKTARWAITETKVRIRRITARTRWELVEFRGRKGGESVGIVDLLAVRKDHRPKTHSLKRGDALQIVLIQVKGGGAAMPNDDDARRLRAVGRRHRAEHLLLALWKKGKQAEFLKLIARNHGQYAWGEIDDLRTIFR